MAATVFIMDLGDGSKAYDVIIGEHDSDPGEHTIRFCMVSKEAADKLVALYESDCVATYVEDE